MIIHLVVGSQLYQLTNPKSDTDYLCITNDIYPFPENKEIEVCNVEELQNKLNKHDLKALEAYFGYPNIFKHVIPVSFNYCPDSLRRSVSAVVSNAHVKAKKKIRDGEIYTGLKSFWHCIRILTMYVDLAKYGTFSPRDYSEKLKDTYLDIMSRINDEPTTMFDKLNETYDTEMRKLLHEFRLLCPKKES